MSSENTEVLTEAPDFLEALRQEWAGQKSFPAELQCFGKQPIKIDVVRMNWAERYHAFNHDPDNANLGLILEIPKRILLRGTNTPLVPRGEMTDQQVIKLLTEEIPPESTKELLRILLAEEHDIDNAKN